MTLLAERGNLREKTVCILELKYLWEYQGLPRFGSLGWEDPLEQAVATYSSILAWRIPWTEELGELQSMGLQRVGHS